MSIKYSFFQLVFGQDETYCHPEKSYERLSRLGYDAIELTPPKGRYGEGVAMDAYAKLHQQLKSDYNMQISCVNECWGAEWDPYSPVYKTLTEKKTARLAIDETRKTIDFAHEVGAPFVTVAVATHGEITRDNVAECSRIAVESLKEMCGYAKQAGIRLVFEATNHLEMGKYVNTVCNHKRLIEATGMDNLGIQIDWFHAYFEELNEYEAVMDAQPLLWHMHFRDSNALMPGLGRVDFRAVFRALLKTGYDGYCTLEGVPFHPDADTACDYSLRYVKLMEQLAAYQIDAKFPNAYKVV